MTELRHTWRIPPGPNEMFTLSAAASMTGKPVTVFSEGREIGNGRIQAALIEPGGALQIHVAIDIDHPSTFGLSLDELSYIIQRTDVPDVP